MLSIGQRVSHSGHGPGEMIEIREGAPQSEYMHSPSFPSACAENQLVGALALAVSAYSAERYPYRVRFDSGFEEVYGEHELEVLP